MKCPNCGRENDDDSKFCTHCGTPLQAAQQTAATGHSASSNRAATGDQINAAASKGKKIAKSYWGFLIRTLKHPVNASYEETSHLYGYISMVLYSFFFSLGIVLLTRNAASSALGYFGSSDVPLPNMTGMFFKLFFTAGFFIFVTALVVFAIVHLIFKTTMPFHTFVSQFMGQATLSVFVMALFFLLELVHINNFLSFVLLYAGIFLLFIPETSIAFTCKSNDRFDRIYTFLITLVLTGIAQTIYLVIVGMSMIQSIVEELERFNPMGF
ncbi:zinc ribbon domain-containing protein [Sporolactobacillus sp. THM19-2]|uniref:zinc ribbon domain-containing protein n=1 Tax=Sporolactobacillus sp. THM19-2 TaxID=2511171 RepID=UPI0010207B6B|nr:zinc ribbon domain-containing protein [Sporolactobacillus sp. THM19-2]RYL94016.1 zinc ribbon domain-containing protein [Sporolactobacillus sp. THM19-2]